MDQVEVEGSNRCEKGKEYVVAGKTVYVGNLPMRWFDVLCGHQIGLSALELKGKVMKILE